MVFCNLILRSNPPSPCPPLPHGVKDLLFGLFFPRCMLASSFWFALKISGCINGLEPFTAKRFLLLFLLFLSSAKPTGKRRLKSHAIPCIRLEGRFVTMMNVLVSGLRETLPLLPKSMNHDTMIQKAERCLGGSLHVFWCSGKEKD